MLESLAKCGGQGQFQLRSTTRRKRSTNSITRWCDEIALRELPRKQCFDVGEGLGVRQSGEGATQVGVGHQPVGAGSFNQAVERGTGVRAVRGASLNDQFLRL